MGGGRHPPREQRAAPANRARCSADMHLSVPCAHLVQPRVGDLGEVVVLIVEAHIVGQRVEGAVVAVRLLALCMASKLSTVASR